MKKFKQPRIRDPPFDDDHGKRNKDYDLRACTWNVRTLNWEGAAAQLVDVFAKIKADITAVQEMRWTGLPTTIDHVVVDGRHVSSVLDVRALRGPNIDSDHYLVAAKIRTRLCAAKNARQQTQGRFDVEKLQSQQTAERFSTRLALLLSESTSQQLGIRELWDGISNSLRTAATETIGFRKEQKNSWYDEECRVAAERKQAAYLAMLRSTTTRAGWDSTKRSCLYAAMSEFGIPAKLIRLCKLMLNNTKSSVRIGKDLSEQFDTKRGFRQCDSLSCDFFNLLLEKIVRAAELNREGTIFYKSVQLLAYADDIDIIGLNTRTVRPEPLDPNRVTNSRRTRDLALTSLLTVITLKL